MGEPGSIIWGTDPYRYLDYAALAMALGKIPGGDPPDWSHLKDAGLISHEQIAELTSLHYQMISLHLGAQAEMIKRQSEIHSKIATMITKNMR